jgi:hypothetical protein
MSHIAPISMKVAATLPAYRIVTALTGTGNSVKLPANALERPLGITTDTVLDTNQGIPVAIAGIAKLQFNDTITSGKMVAPDSGGLGLGVAHADTTAGSYVVGVLIGPSVSVTGTIADVLVQPHFKSIP